MKIIIHPEGIENLWCDNIIYKIIPELETVETTPGGEHHNETVKQHLGYAFKEACKITDNTLLRLAIFLHDLGKGVTYSYIESGEEHFYGHENTGAYAAKDRMKILKFSKEEVDYVFTLIKCHMYSYKVTPGKKSYIRFFNTLEAAKIPIEDYVMLLYCDHQGNRAKPRIKFGDFIKGNWVYSL